ncbi:SoxR reducing system RseC family protein [Eubacteriaceae bacterium ES2]|nr:SoxR reducing system RseC family protein [Eubacteriaceae bacterium ES2]
MKEIGIIKNKQGNDAVVSIKRHAACGDCGACHIGKDKASVETVAKNPIHASIGETVEVEMAFVSVFRAAMICYGIPLLFFLIGSVLSYALIVQLNSSLDPVLTPFFSGIALLIVAYLGIRVLDKKGLFQSRYQPVITAITTPFVESCTPSQKKMGN